MKEKSQLSKVKKQSQGVLVYGYHKRDDSIRLHLVEDKEYLSDDGLTPVVRRFTAMYTCTPELVEKTELANLSLKQGSQFMDVPEIYPADRLFNQSVSIEVTETIFGNNPDHQVKSLNGQAINIPIAGKSYPLYRYTDLVARKKCEDVYRQNIMASFYNGEQIRMFSRSHSEFAGRQLMSTREAIEEMEGVVDEATGL